MTDYGMALKKIRKYYDYTQQQLAERLNVTSQAISKWENNVNQMDITSIQEICKIFGITVDDFIRIANGAVLTEILHKNDVESGATPPADAVAENGATAAVSKKKVKLTYIIIAAVVALVVAAIILTTTLLLVPRKLSAEQVYEKVNPSVFYIEVETEGGDKKGGSGFFIDGKGTAVTNYHVMEDGVSAEITLYNGEKYAVNKVLGYDANRDLTVFNVDIPKSTPVALGDSNKIKTGETVYAIGYPESFVLGHGESTLTDGIISKTNYNIEGYGYVQTNADITHGNSGGVLVNGYGQVVGVTTGQIDIGGVRYMNLAVPVNSIKAVKRSYSFSMSEFYAHRQSLICTVTFYDGDSVLSSEEMYVGGRVKELSYPKTGYTFEGWFAESACENPFDFTSALQGREVNIYGKWTPVTYYIAYYSDESKTEMSRQEATYGEEVTLSQNLFKRKGYKFSLWKTEQGYSYFGGESVRNLACEQGQEVSLIAEWQSFRYGVYTEELGSDGKYVKRYQKSVAYEEEFTLGKQYEWEGSKFLYWLYDGRKIRPGDTLSKLSDYGEDITIKAVMRTVSFIEEDGSKHLYTSDAYSLGDNSVTLNFVLPQKEGHEFLGWEYKGKTISYDGTLQGLTEDDVTVEFVAKWRAFRVTVFFKSYKDDGDYITKMFYCDYGKSITVPEPSVVRTGYHFVCWNNAHGDRYFVGDTFTNEYSSDGYKHSNGHNKLTSRIKVAKFNVILKGQSDNRLSFCCGYN